MNELLQVAGNAIGFPFLVDIVAGAGAVGGVLGISSFFLPPSGVKAIGKAIGIILRVVRQKPSKDREFVGSVRGTVADLLGGIEDGLK